MRMCSQFSLAVVALSFLALAGCAHAGAVKATGLTGPNAPVMTVMGAAGKGAADTGYAKRQPSPIEQAMSAQATGAYAKRGQ